MQATARSRTRAARSALGVVSLVLGLAIVAAGCAAPGLTPDGSSKPTDEPAPADRVHVQARDALERWAEAVRTSGGAAITFTGDLTSQIGEWEAENEANKASLVAGIVEASTDLPTDKPSRKEVKWLDGTKVDVGVITAQAALDALVEAGAGAECRGCLPLQVIDAQLATGLVETSRGPAEVPMWVFTIKSTTVRVTRVAVDESVTVVPPAWNADDPPVGISIDTAAGSADSRKVEVTFVGAVEDASDPCGADYAVEALESELAVVIIVVKSAGNGPCRAIGKTRTATVTLDAKLGERAVLEVRQGLPVPVVAP
jgi:hypothetical protein